MRVEEIKDESKKKEEDEEVERGREVLDLEMMREEQMKKRLNKFREGEELKRIVIGALMLPRLGFPSSP